MWLWWGSQAKIGDHVDMFMCAYLASWLRKSPTNLKVTIPVSSFRALYRHLHGWDLDEIAWKLLLCGSHSKDPHIYFHLFPSDNEKSWILAKVTKSYIRDTSQMGVLTTITNLNWARYFLPLLRKKAKGVKLMEESGWIMQMSTSSDQPLQLAGQLCPLPTLRSQSCAKTSYRLIILCINCQLNVLPPLHILWGNIIVDRALLTRIELL